jgi:hypothetical protein
VTWAGSESPRSSATIRGNAGTSVNANTEAAAAKAPAKTRIPRTVIIAQLPDYAGRNLKQKTE